MNVLKALMLRGAMVVALVSATGCGVMGFRQPKIDLESAHLGGLGLRGGTLLVNLRIENPNGFSLTADRLRYDLAVRESERTSDTTWIPFATGTHDQSFTVSGGETKVVQIPIEFAYSGLGSATSSIMRSGTFVYRARGEVDVRTPVGTRQVPFTKRGTMTMSGPR